MLIYSPERRLLHFTVQYPPEQCGDSVHSPISNSVGETLERQQVLLGQALYKNGIGHDPEICECVRRNLGKVDNQNYLLSIR